MTKVWTWYILGSDHNGNFLRREDQKFVNLNTICAEDKLIKLRNDIFRIYHRLSCTK